MRLSDITPEMHARHEHDCGWLECGPDPKPKGGQVYLAGPINGTTDSEMNNWRQDLAHRMPNTTFIDPTTRDYRGHEDTNVAAIVEQDKDDIDNCECVVAYCPHPSVGTSMEVLYAWQQGQRVLIWAPPDAPISPWLRYHSHAICHYAQEVEAALIAWRLGCSFTAIPAGRL